MYKNRTDAGRRLAAHLDRYKDKDVLVLALPRGGVEVGYEVAEALDAELDVLVVRKLGAPQNRELGMGAIASYGARYVDEGMVQSLGVSSGDLERIERNEREELERRESAYRGDRPPPKVEGRTVILIDDGIATGGTVRAAVQGIGSLKPGKLILAVPVAPSETVEALRNSVDELVCPEMPSPFRAIGLWYDQFEQTTDEQVVELLNRRREHAESRDMP